MRLDFCVACGAREALHHHHLDPRTASRNDDETNLITLCEVCHGRVHGRTFRHHRELQRIGIERAKASGVYTGRKEPAERNAFLNMMLSVGLSVSTIKRVAKTSRTTVWRIAQRPRLALPPLSPDFRIPL